MHRNRRALAFLWRALRFTLRVLFILMMIAIPIPVFPPRYRPHRDPKNPIAMVLKKE
ncbi:MAG TPA: hypothetical protein VFA20_04320 [Myxococcaceae bacterium]|nr:hypothetical protein [Myxococcaceae bacterium]